MKWVDLKIHLAPFVMKQINEVSKKYMSKYLFFLKLILFSLLR